MSAAIAIFVKTPGLSAVKSRLAAACGREWAEDWYGRAAAAVSEVARRAQPDEQSVYWAVAEAAALERAVWSALPRIVQGEGDLGERMARVHETLIERHGAAILIGADAPQLCAADVILAIDWLHASAPRQVLGPARDGGFWLYGSNRTAARPAWTQVRYSSADTAEQFRRSIDCGSPWLTLRELRDVDTAADLQPCRDALVRLDAATPAQRALAQWMALAAQKELPA